MNRRDFITVTGMSGLALAIPNFSLAAESKKERPEFILTRNTLDNSEVVKRGHAFKNMNYKIIKTKKEIRYFGIVESFSFEPKDDGGITILQYHNTKSVPLKIFLLNKNIFTIGEVITTHYAYAIFDGNKNYHGYAKFDNKIYEDAEQIKVMPFYDKDGKISFYLVTEFIYKNMLTSETT